MGFSCKTNIKRQRGKEESNTVTCTEAGTTTCRCSELPRKADRRNNIFGKDSQCECKLKLLASLRDAAANIRSRCEILRLPQSEPTAPSSTILIICLSIIFLTVMSLCTVRAGTFAIGLRVWLDRRYNAHSLRWDLPLLH